jgi:hypothetical protein
MTFSVNSAVGGFAWLAAAADDELIAESMAINASPRRNWIVRDGRGG